MLDIFFVDIRDERVRSRNLLTFKFIALSCHLIVVGHCGQILRWCLICSAFKLLRVDSSTFLCFCYANGQLGALLLLCLGVAHRFLVVGGCVGFDF